MKTPIVVFGASGRMGRMILNLAAGQPDRFDIVGAVEHGDHPLLGQPVTSIAAAPDGLKLEAEPPDRPPSDTIGIHFSLPEATVQFLQWHRRHGLGAVIGTTGLTDAQCGEVEKAATDAAMLLTPNTSTGVNVLFWLAGQAARLLGPDYDVEIVEMHHHHKKDAPSGTARRLAEVILNVRDGQYRTDVRHGREGITGERPRHEIGMHALRGGDVVGDHTVVLAGPCERLELTHRAHSRETFARGALRAAGWLHGKAPGMYSMNDVLGL